MREISTHPRRIVLANDSRLLREILERVFRQHPELEVVDEVSDPARALTAVEENNAQWVIVSLPPDGGVPDIVETLLAEQPSLRILAVARNGSQVKVHWMEPHAEMLEGLTLEGLLAILEGE